MGWSVHIELWLECLRRGQRCGETELGVTGVSRRWIEDETRSGVVVKFVMSRGWMD